MLISLPLQPQFQFKFSLAIHNLGMSSIIKVFSKTINFFITVNSIFIIVIFFIIIITITIFTKSVIKGEEKKMELWVIGQSDVYSLQVSDPCPSAQL